MGPLTDEREGVICVSGGNLWRFFGIVMVNGERTGEKWSKDGNIDVPSVVESWEVSEMGIVVEDV